MWNCAVLHGVVMFCLWRCVVDGVVLHEGSGPSYRATAFPHRQSMGMVPPTASVARHLPITVSNTSLGER